MQKFPAIQEAPMGAVLMTEQQVAERLHCSIKTLQAWRCRGGGPPFIRLGRLVRYQTSDLDYFIQTNRWHSTSQVGNP